MIRSPLTEEWTPEVLNMTVQSMTPGLWRIPLGFVNSYLLETDDGLVVVDTGVAGDAPKILDAVKSIGKQPSDLHHILVTHCHSDHSGSLAELKRLTGAKASMHPIDADMVRRGQALRPLHPAPGLINALVCRFLVPSAPTEIEKADIENEVLDGANLPGGLQAVHAPGHCAGQLAFLWPKHGGVLIAADAAANFPRLNRSPFNEDLDEAMRSLTRLAALNFEVACFGHGGPILSDAAVKFRRKWRPNVA